MHPAVQGNAELDLGKVTDGEGRRGNEGLDQISLRSALRCIAAWQQSRMDEWVARGFLSKGLVKGGQEERHLPHCDLHRQMRPCPGH